MANHKEHSVLLLKSEQMSVRNTNTSDQYAEMFKTLNLPNDVVHVIDFDYHNMKTLNDKLSSPELYSGIIFTSPRPVKAVALACRGNLKPEWKDLPSFALGERTAAFAKGVLSLDCQGSSSGCGYQLAKFISENSGLLNGKPLLFPHGNLRSDSVLDNLTGEGIAADCIEVYITKPHCDLEKNLLEVLNRRRINVVIFFSPSGVKFSLPILKKYVDYIHTIKFLAIGVTTEGALLQEGLHVSSTAIKPSPSSVAKALEKILR